MRNVYFTSNSDIKMSDIKEIVNKMNPIKIIINKNVVWDDDYDDIKKYDCIFTLDYTIKEFKFQIVSFHHSVVTIKTK